MRDYQIINLAYEIVDLMDLGFTYDEALEEIQAVLETEYIKELESEIDEEILYGWDEVLSDIMIEIKKVYHMTINNKVLN